MQQEASNQTNIAAPNVPISDLPREFELAGEISHHESLALGEPQFSEPTLFESARPIEPIFLATEIEAPENFSSLTVDCGSMKMDSAGNSSYVGSAHWATILDSISELKHHFEEEEETRRLAKEVDETLSGHSNWPQLLYGCPQTTAADILSSIPTRREVDRLVSRYFALDLAPGESTTLALPTRSLSTVQPRWNEDLGAETTD